MTLPVARVSAFEQLIGSWQVTMSTWSEDGEETQSDQITAQKEWFADGRYIKELVAGEFGNEHHEKLTLLSYNLTRARFEYLTADNHDGVLLLYAGAPGGAKCDNRIEMFAEYAAPDEQGQAAAGFIVIRTVIEVESSQQHVLRNFYRPGGRPERLFLQYIYTRNEP